MSFGSGPYWTTYGLGPLAGSSIREDLLDLITMIDPWDTPFFSSAPKSQAKHVLHEWLTDSLAATSTAGAIEGDDFSAASLTNRVRLNNQCQIFRKDIAVSDTTRAINPAGVRDEYEYQVMKGLREIARNIESKIFGSATGVAASGASGASARTMGGMAAYAVQVLNVSAGITSGVVIALHQTLYTSGGDPDTLYVAPGPKRALTANIAGSSTANVRNIAATDRKLIANIDVFESDFGLLAVVPDRFMPQSSVTSTATSAVANRAWLIERSKARVAFLRPIKHVPIGKGGDSTRGIVLGELTLEVLHPSAHGALCGISDT